MVYAARVCEVHEQGVWPRQLEAISLFLGLASAGRESSQPEDDLAAYRRLRLRPGQRRSRALCASGHPAALWLRCNEQHADCTEFCEGAAELLRSVGASDGSDGLREQVLSLRNQNAGDDISRSATAWAGQFVLLYDPPHGPQLPDGPLREPPLSH